MSAQAAIGTCIRVHTHLDISLTTDSFTQTITSSGPAHTMAFFNQQPPAGASPYDPSHPSLQFYGQPSGSLGGSPSGGLYAGYGGGGGGGGPAQSPYGQSGLGVGGPAGGRMDQMGNMSGASWSAVASEGKWWHAFGTGGLEGEPSLMEGESCPHVPVSVPCSLAVFFSH